MIRAQQLTERQVQVIALVRRGLSNAEIAEQLGISEDGVKAHLSRLFLRFDVTNRVALLSAVDAGTQKPVGSTLAELRAIVGRGHERTLRLGNGDMPMSASGRIAVARDALAAVDAALDLVRDLPPETTGAVLDALRRRVASAVAALDEVDPSLARAGSASAL